MTKSIILFLQHNVRRRPEDLMAERDPAADRRHGHAPPRTGQVPHPGRSRTCRAVPHQDDVRPAHPGVAERVPIPETHQEGGRPGRLLQGPHTETHLADHLLLRAALHRRGVQDARDLHQLSTTEEADAA